MRPGLVFFVVAMVAVGGCGGASHPSEGQQVTRVLRTYLRAQASGDGEAACSTLTASAQRQLEALIVSASHGLLKSTPACPDAVRLVHAAAGAQLLAALAGARIEHIQVRGPVATAEVADESRFASQQVLLNKVDGVWRIAGVPTLRG